MRTCEVVEECLEFGLYEATGVFGGKSKREREKIRRARAAARGLSIKQQRDGYRKEQAVDPYATVAESRRAVLPIAIVDRYRMGGS